MRGITPEERIPADPKAKLKLVMLLLGVIALYFLWEPALEYLTPLEDDSAPPSDQLAALRLRSIVMFGSSVAFSLFCAYWTFRLALRIRKSGQFPPPGMPVLFSTVVKRGKEVHTLSQVLFVLSGIGVLSAGLYLWALSVMLDIMTIGE